MWMNDADDFCLWAPPSSGSIGVTEREEVAYCTKSGRGTRVIPDGTLTGVHFVQTPDYVQVTGTGDFTKINVKKGDYGGGEHAFPFFLLLVLRYLTSPSQNWTLMALVCIHIPGAPVNSWLTRSLRW
jgi:hypothetical protein